MKLRIGLWEYQVEVLDKLNETKDRFEVGKSDHKERAILLLRSYLSTPDGPNTILHEVLHALDRQLCLRLTEFQVNALTGGLEAVLRDNPQLLELGQTLLENAAPHPTTSPESAPPKKPR